MTPSWYDLLDVDPGATGDEIRAAWRARVSDLDPTDRRFAVLNEAAAVLLDPARRAAHDAELAERHTEVGPAEQPTDEPEEPHEPDRLEHGPTHQPVGGRRLRGLRGRRTPPGGGEEPRSRWHRVPWWLPALLGALALAVAATAVWFAVTVPTDEEVLSATRTAQATAERAIVPVLSYDHRTLAEDRAAALELLTDDFRDDYEQLFTQIEENAPSTRTVVEAEVRASAITRGGEDRAQLLLFVDQVTTNAQTSEPVTYRNQVTVTMERVGDRWLVDDLRTTRG